MIPRNLRALARLHGLQLSYRDAASGARVTAGIESVLAVLRCLDVPVQRLSEVPAALDEALGAAERPRLEPVAVAWEGAGSATLVLPKRAIRGRLEAVLVEEDGRSHRWSVSAGRLPARRSRGLAGASSRRVALPLPRLRTGYHRLRVRLAGAEWECLVIAARRKCYGSGDDRRIWGAFLPLHALRTPRDWGGGDLADLGEALRWMEKEGGHAFGLLPLLSTYPGDERPSPYAPLSRVFWNEIWLDVESVPGLQACPEALSRMGSPGFRRDLARLRAAPFAEPARTLDLKRKVLEPLARAFWSGPASRDAAFRRYLEEAPDAEPFARFRAQLETRGGPWSRWPARQREGRLRRGDHDEGLFRYHLYVQWQTHVQVEAAGRAARASGQGLYLDLPLGTTRDGFDTWRAPGLFALRASAGAPPDAFFQLGQSWGIPPLRPAATRSEGHGYLRACLRQHMRPAAFLRVDHVMGLHRLYWVPEEMKATEGVYVRYPARELYAILSIESHRHRTVVIGEDLGTVAPETRVAMRRHGLRRTWVFPFDAAASGSLPPAPEGSLAMLNTHDMPTFAGLWEGRDIRDRRELGLIDDEEARAARKERTRMKQALVRVLRREGRLRGKSAGARAVLAACLASLAAGPAGIVLVTLEDLWGEKEQQNTPGTVSERPNWRRRARLDLQALAGRASIRKALADVRRAREEGA